MNENENENKKVEQTPPAKNDVDIAKAYQELQKNSISKEEYQKALKENNELKKIIIDGRKVEETPKKADLKELAKNWQKPNQSNLEYCDNMLKYRKALIESGERDPFMPQGRDYKYDEADQKSAERVAEVMQECIDQADGNSQVFTALLNSKMVDDNNLLSALARKRSGIK